MAPGSVTPPGQTVTMERQLVLLDADRAQWRLDDHTREVGRRGIDDARAALSAAATRPTTRSHPTTPSDERRAA